MNAPRRKAAFLNPPGPRNLYRGSVCTYLSKAGYVWKPKDFLISSGQFGPDWDVVFLDAARGGHDAAAGLEWVRRENPDGILTVLSSIHWEEDLAFLRDLRAAVPGVRLAVFGEALLEPAFAARAAAYCDHVLFDPPRADLPALLGGGAAAAQEPPAGSKTPLDWPLGTPRHALFDDPAYHWPFSRRRRFAAVYTEYGCPFSCSYCPESKTTPHVRPAPRVLEELRALRADGYRELVFGDASFGHPRANAEAILDAMIAEDMGWSWSAYTHPSLADAAMLERMKRSGCHTLVIGVDSVDPERLGAYNRRVVPDTVRAMVAAAHARGIAVCGDFILGFPGEDAESCRRTAAFAVELDLDYASFNIATPLVGSAFRDQFAQRGLLGSGASGFDTAGENRVAGNGVLDADELLALRAEACRRFYFRPSYLWKRLRAVGGFEEFSLKAVEGFWVAWQAVRQSLAAARR